LRGFPAGNLLPSFWRHGLPCCVVFSTLDASGGEGAGCDDNPSKIGGSAMKRFFLPATGELTMRRFFLAAMVINLAISCAESLYADGFKSYRGYTESSYDDGFGDPPIGTGGWTQPTPTPPIHYYSLDGTGAETGNTSTAQFGLSPWATPTTAACCMAPGSGVTQHAPAGGNSPATLHLSCETFAFSDDVNPGYMTNIVGYYNLPLVGTVANDGYVDVQLKAIYTGNATGSSGNYGEVFSVTLTDGWHDATAGTATHTLSGSIDLPDLIPEMQLNGADNYWVDIGLDVTFTVKNDDGPVGLSMPEGFTFGSEGTPIAAPEPSTFVLLGIGAVSLLAYAWRRRRQAV
jgi:hypothetical protein